MTTFAAAAPTPITSSLHHSTTPSRGSVPSGHIGPVTVHNESRSTQASPTSSEPAHTEAAREPNAFLTRMDELAQVILDGPQVAWAIEQGMSSTEIASWCGIRQGSDAYRMLESRVEARYRTT
ncbi:hypothetical protein [Stenotrophomonas sp.]|uniref:hypothetical protein n=1 Tax=Stenotrophomonas sp. TaxID=69392 RepID=UPI0028AF580E|nr:hypothetical protein [Stenotrophomonas sp.]